MTPIIKIENFSKNYASVLAVDNINLEINRGEMYGLVGPDGAGKTTTIRTMCGLLKPTSGNVRLFGKDSFSEKSQIQHRIGYLSQIFSLYGDLSVDENLEFFAQIHNVSNYESRRDELLEFTRLKPFRNRYADKLSGGMKQKLALACSLIHKPEILLLDEPTTGVDPVSRRDFWKILAELLKDGLTVVISTPYLDEAERCSRVALMNKGKILISDTPDNVKKSINKTILEVVCSPVLKASELLRKNKFEVQTFGDRLNVVLNEPAEKSQVSDILGDDGINVSGMRELPPSLENVFIHLIKESS